jgi:hypothetical protein
VSVDSTTGAVSLTCTPVYAVSATISGGTMTNVNLRDQTLMRNNEFDNVSTSASVLMPGGHIAEVQLTSGDTGDGGGVAFNYTCPGAASQSASPFAGSDSGIYYYAVCEDSSLSGDYAVTATFSGG